MIFTGAVLVPLCEAVRMDSYLTCPRMSRSLNIPQANQHDIRAATSVPERLEAIIGTQAASANHLVQFDRMQPWAT